MISRIHLGRLLVRISALNAAPLSTLDAASPMPPLDWQHMQPSGGVCIGKTIITFLIFNLFLRHIECACLLAYEVQTWRAPNIRTNPNVDSLFSDSRPFVVHDWAGENSQVSNKTMIFGPTIKTISNNAILADRKYVQADAHHRMAITLTILLIAVVQVRIVR